MKETREFVNVDRLTRRKSTGEAYTEDGGLTWRWVSNNQVIDLDICREYGIPCDPEAQAAARKAMVDAFLREYRKNQPAQPSPEEVAEARAAFGPGREVVDVVTGRGFRT